MTNETKTPMERLTELEEEKDAIYAALRIERTELRKRLEAIEEKLGPERVKRPRKAKVEGEAPKPRKKKNALGSGIPAEVLT